MQLNLLSGIEWIATNIWEALQQLGGVAIVTALCSFIAHKMNVHYEKRIENKYNTEIAKLQTKLDSLSHIRNRQFDTKFIVYQELCSSFYSMISAVHWLFPSGFDRSPVAKNFKDICNDRYKQAQDKFKASVSLLGSKAPFMDKEIYDKFAHIQTLASKQISSYYFANPIALESRNGRSLNAISVECYNRTDEIDKLWSTLLDSLRIHIQDFGKD